MASGAEEDVVVLVLTDPSDAAAESCAQEGEPEEITVATSEIRSWDIDRILRCPLVRVRASRSSLIRESSYFRGLLGGSFSESGFNHVSIQCNLRAATSVLQCICGAPVDVQPDNFLLLLEGALFFGVEVLLSECKTWFQKMTTVRAAHLFQIPLDIVTEIWNYSLEHQLYFRDLHCLSCSKLCSEKQLCEALLLWITSNVKSSKCSCDSEKNYTSILKMVRFLFLPLAYSAGKRRSCCFSKVANESINAIFGLMEDFEETLSSAITDNDPNLKLRLTQYSEKIDFSGCAHLTVDLLYLAVLPSDVDSLYRKRIIRTLIGGSHQHGASHCILRKLPTTLTFVSVSEVDMSKCPKVHFGALVNFLCISFPSLQTLKLSYCSHFKIEDLFSLLQNCPSINDVDLTVDISPILPTQVSISSASSEEYQALGGSPYATLHHQSVVSNIAKLTLEGRTDLDGIEARHMNQLMRCLFMLKRLSLRDTSLTDDSLSVYRGSLLESLDISGTLVSFAALGHVVRRNPGIRILKVIGCKNLYDTGGVVLRFNGDANCEDLYSELNQKCFLEEVSFGWGFSSSSMTKIKNALRGVRAMTLGLGTSLDLSLLPDICPFVETLILNFQAHAYKLTGSCCDQQVISDCDLIGILASLSHLKVLDLCCCLGDLTSKGFQISMTNLTSLRLERATPWMTNEDLVILTGSCPNLTELSLSGCKLLSSDVQRIISSGWPGLTVIHLEDCGNITSAGVSFLLDCVAIEDLLLRHNGRGIRRNIISDATRKLPLLRKVALDTCDACEGGFDSPSFAEKLFLSTVKIARCKPQRCSFDLRKLGSFRPVHKDTIVQVWNSKELRTTCVEERV